MKRIFVKRHFIQVQALSQLHVTPFVNNTVDNNDTTNALFSLFVDINEPTFINTFLMNTIFFQHFQLWLTLAERYLNTKAVDWKKAERTCFNEWSNPDDDELGLQIVRVSFLDTGTTYKTFLYFWENHQILTIF